MENSILSTQLYCEPKTALKNKDYFKNEAIRNETKKVESSIFCVITKNCKISSERNTSQQ